MSDAVTEPAAPAAASDAADASDAAAGAPAPVVSILIVNYNTRELTLDCLRSIAAETKVPHETIVVDNASRDGSADAIAAQFPDVKLIRSPENLGFGCGNNRAAERAAGEYILLLNSDTVVLDGAIDKLVAFARELPQARMWGGRTLFPDGRVNPQSGWRLPSTWNIFCRTAGLNALFPNSPLFHSEAYAGWRRDSVRSVEMIIGCYLMTTREMWDKLKGFDEQLFMYGDDVDLCFRARKLGADPHVTPASTIIHYGGSSDTVRADKVVKLMRGKISVVQRHFGWDKPLALGILRLWPFTRVAAMTVLAPVRPSLKAKRDVWGEIWRQRAVWWNGY